LIRKQPLPYPWRQFDDTLCRVLIDALQHINQVSIGLNVLQLAGVNVNRKLQVFDN